MPRVFFALWPEDAQRDELYRAAQSAHVTSGGRLMRRENLHQTLVFIGTVAAGKVAEINSAAASVDATAFELKFGTLRYWRHNRIVWAAPLATPKPLLAMLAALESALDHANVAFDRRPYAPHTTLIRDARSPAEFAPLKFGWPVRDFTLVESANDSSGVVYRVIARWPLAA